MRKRVRLSGFDHLSVVRGAAVLALWPPNADRHGALNQLVDDLASDHGARRRRPVIGRMDWATWLEARSSRWLRETWPHGIHDAPLSVAGLVFGSPVALIGGDLESPDLHYSMWASALERVEQRGADVHLARALALLRTVAYLSNAVVVQARLGQHEWPAHVAGGSIVVPTEPHYEQLLTALSFSAEDLASTPWIDSKSIDALTREPDNDPMWRPLVALGDGGIAVADPWRLTAAGLVHACAAVRTSQLARHVFGELRSAALDVAIEAARDMQWSVTRLDPSSAIAEADIDCRILLAVHVLHDDPAEPHGPAQMTSGTFDVAHGVRLQQATDLEVDHALLAVLGDGRPVSVRRDHACLEGGGTRPWLLSLAELRLLGDALRCDPLALPIALERIPPRPWPESFDLVDFVGCVRRAELPPPQQAQLPTDGTEHLVHRARHMAVRHPAPAATPGEWCEVTRWELTPNDSVFARRERTQLELAVRTAGRTTWIGSNASDTDPSSLTGAIVAALTEWLTRLHVAGWPTVPDVDDPTEHVTSLRVELSPLPGPELAIARTPALLRLIIGPGFAHSLSKSDNSAERMLLEAIVADDESLTPESRSQLVDAVAPLGDATLVIWPDPAVTTRGRLALEPPLVATRDRTSVQRLLVSEVLPPGGHLLAEGDDALRLTRALTETLDRLISTRIATLQSEALFALVALHDQAAVHSYSLRVALPARDAFPGADQHFGPYEPNDARDIALRALVERFAAMPPNDASPLSRRRTGWLRAAAELQLTLGSYVEAAETGLASLRLAIAPGVVAVTLDGELPVASGLMGKQLEAATPALMRSEHRAWWGDGASPAPPTFDQPIEFGDPAWDELNAATEEEWGVGIERVVRVLRTLHEPIDQLEACGVEVRTRDVLAAYLTNITKIPMPTMLNIIDLLTLDRSDTFSTLHKAYAPWKPNRARSYLRQPLVQLDEEKLAWSHQHAMDAMRNLLGLVATNRLRGGARVRAAANRIARRQDLDFEEVLREEVVRLGWNVRFRVRVLAGRRMERSPEEGIGDIDVLAWSSARATVWLLDAKHISPGMDPHTMARESDKLARHAKHHRERLDWINQRSDLLAATINEDLSGWTVRAAIVLDRPLAGAHLAPTSMEFWTLAELPEHLAR
jgi:hypothetical protein